MNRQDLFPPIEPYHDRHAARSTRTTRCIGSSRAIRTACRSCSCMAARAPARRRPIAASSIPRTTASSSSTSAAPAARRRWARSRTTPPAHLVADHRGAAPASRHRALGGVRRLVGLDPGAAYAEAHPERCRGLVLRGIFLCRRSEIDWFLYGMRTVFPEAWRAFAGFLPEAERGDLLAAYYRRLIDPDPALHMPAARAWSTYEGACSTLLPSPDTVAAFGEDRMALGLARIEAHYFRCDVIPPERRSGRACRPHPPSAGGHRPGPLRHGLPDRQRRRAGARLARGRIHRRPRCRPFGDGARHPQPARRRHRAPQAQF